MVQGPKKWLAKCDEHYPGRSGQTSLATAVANFTKPRTGHFFYLCICNALTDILEGDVADGALEALRVDGPPADLDEDAAEMEFHVNNMLL